MAWNSFSEMIQFLALLSPSSSLLIEYAPNFATHLEDIDAVADSPPVQKALRLLYGDSLTTAKARSQKEIKDEIMGRLRTDLLASGKLRQISLASV